MGLVCLLPWCTVSLSPDSGPSLEQAWSSGELLVPVRHLDLRGVLACVSEEADAHSTC